MGMIAGSLRMVRTRSGGLHVYFAGTTQRNGSLPGAHLDFRAAGGYVLAPPSTVEGAPYELLVSHDNQRQMFDWNAAIELLAPAAARRPGRGSTGTVGLITFVSRGWKRESVIVACSGRLAAPWTKATLRYLTTSLPQPSERGSARSKPPALWRVPHAGRAVTAACGLRSSGGYGGTGQPRLPPRLPGGLRPAQGCGQRNGCLAGHRRCVLRMLAWCSRRCSSPGSPAPSARPDCKRDPASSRVDLPGDTAGYHPDRREFSVTEGASLDWPAGCTRTVFPPDRCSETGP